MGLDLLEVTEPSLAYTVVGGFVVAFSLVSLLVKEKLYINEVVLGTLFGILMGPYCANIFDPRSWGGHTNTVTLEVMRVVLATGLFAIGVELPQSYLADHAKGLLVMVVPSMAFGWLVVAGILKALFPAYNFVSALAVAACLTPTDPIICAAIVGGKFAIKHVPTNLRRILAAESAANDGLAYPFLSIAIYLTVEESRKVAIGKWFLIGWLYQVILGVVLGGSLGYGFCFLMKFSLRKGFIDRESYIAQFIALALFTIGVTSTIGSDDLLAAFAAGSAISWDGHFNTQVENLVFSSVIDLVLNCGCFVYIGAWLPFSEFNSPELGIEVWKLVVLFIAILALRRIPPLLLLYKWVPEINGWKEALFSGHFGPMGVGAVFISTLALTRLPEPHSPPRNQEEYLAATLQTIVSFVVLGSIFIHGLSIPFFSFGRRTLSMSRTWTSRQSLNPNVPEWLHWIRSASTPNENFPRTATGVTQYTTGDADLEGGTPETLNSSGEGLNKGGKDVNVEVIGEPGKLKDTGLGTVVISEQEASSSGYNTPGFLRETGKVEDGIGRLRRRGLESSESGNVGTTVPNQNSITSRVTDTENSAPAKIHVPTQGQDSLDPILISERLNRVRSRSPSASGRARLEDRDGMGEEGPGSRIASGNRTPVRMVRFPGDQ